MNNLTKWVDELSEIDLKYLCTVLQNNGVDTSVGTVVFFNREVVIHALQQEIRCNPENIKSRQAKRMLDKISGTQKSLTEFTMYLDDLKVFKRSSGDGVVNRLMRLDIPKVVGAGIQWDAFKRQWIQPTTTVRYQVILSRIKPGLWKVQAESRVYELCRNQLFERCGSTTVSSKRKPRRR